MKKYFWISLFLSLPMISFSQKEVRFEPRHHLVFENDYVRILDVFLSPSDTTQYHQHSTPSIFIFFTSTFITSQLLGQQPVLDRLESGTVLYDSMLTSRIHKVWNSDSTWFHVMDVELKATKHQNTDPVFNNSALQLLFDEKQVRGYKMKLEAGGKLQLPQTLSGYLLISSGDAEISFISKHSSNHRLMKAGHYHWIESGQELMIGNIRGPSTFTLLQLK